MFMAAALVAALGAGTVFGYRSFKPAQRVSDLQLTNAEALSVDEAPKIPCSVSRDDHCVYVVVADSQRVTLVTYDLKPIDKKEPL